MNCPVVSCRPEGGVPWTSSCTSFARVNAFFGVRITSLTGRDGRRFDAGLGRGVELEAEGLGSDLTSRFEDSVAVPVYWSIGTRNFGEEVSSDSY
jgi:hypothetical protein